MTTPICPHCAQNALTAKTYSDQFKHGEQVVTVYGLKYFLCGECDGELITPDQIRHDQRVIADGKRQQDGLLSGTEIIYIRKKLKLTQKGAAALFGGGANAFSKYERGEVIQSEPMDKLLRLAADIPQVVARLKKPPKSPLSTPAHRKNPDISPSVARH